jgi:hypothetical protein
MTDERPQAPNAEPKTSEPEVNPGESSIHNHEETTETVTEETTETVTEEPAP